VSQFAKGTQLKVGNGASPEVFTLIPHIRSVEGPPLERDELESTTHDTPENLRDWVPGLLDIGLISFEFQWVPGQALHAQLISDAMTGTERNYQLVYPDAGNWTISFRGFVKSISPAAPFDQLLTRSAQIRIKGDPVPIIT
jgi:hypothetical protein